LKSFLCLPLLIAALSLACGGGDEYTSGKREISDPRDSLVVRISSDSLISLFEQITPDAELDSAFYASIIRNVEKSCCPDGASGFSMSPELFYAKMEVLGKRVPSDKGSLRLLIQLQFYLFNNAELSEVMGLETPGWVKGNIEGTVEIYRDMSQEERDHFIATLAWADGADDKVLRDGLLHVQGDLATIAREMESAIDSVGDR